MNADDLRQVFEVLTLFPAAVEQFAATGLLGKACERGLVRVHCTDVRTFTANKHRTVDDAPFGGGPGMVMKVEPIVAALEAIEVERGPMHRVLLTPAGARFDQRVARRLSQHHRVALICGRYEGIDDRVREHFVHESLSLGDFVLSGGEVAALAIIEAVARLHEGVLGNPESIMTESFTDSLLEFPQYTRPASFRGHEVPPVLFGGDHAAIAAWRRARALERTFEVRPDLRAAAKLPRALPIYLAFASAPTDLERLADTVRRHAVEGVVAVGDGMDARVLEWARQSGGRLQIAAFANLSGLRRRLRRAHGGAVRLIAVTAHTEPDAVSDARVVTELVASGEQAAAVVLLAGMGGEGEVDFAPYARSSGRTDGLALAGAIDDASQPSGPDAVHLADLALTALRPPKVATS